MSAQSRVLRITEPVTNGGMDQKPKLDPKDPRVRKLVYSMYQDMLKNCNEEANDFIGQQDPELVKQDLGVGPILETIIRQGSSGSGGSTPTTPVPAPASVPSPAPAPPVMATPTPNPPSVGSTAPPPPPAPPLTSTGSIPSVRLNSEVGPLNKGPPKAIQGAMMKDKKPFTYTPGGIDLSEIRSPRMAKRIQMNAAAEGVTSVPTQPANPSNSPAQHPYLPPAALAAMQPAMPISVLPQGGFNPANLHRTYKPPGFGGGSGQDQESNFQNKFGPPPPPPPQRFSAPDETSPPVRFALPQQQQEPRPMQMNFPQDPPKSLASVMTQSVRAPQGPPMQQSQPPQQYQPSQPPQYQPPQPPQYQPPQPPQYQPSQYQPPQPPQQFQPPQPPQQFQPPQTPQQFQPPQPPQQFQQSQVPQQYQQVQQSQTKPQTVSQNIGSIYIPPLEPKVEQSTTAPIPDTGRRNSFEIELEKERNASRTPQTPQLNKAPVPWMNSQNRVPNSPPYIGSTPWGNLNPGQGRTIPISIVRDEKEDDDVDNTQKPVRPPPQQQQQQNAPGARVIPFQIQMTNNVGGGNVMSNGARMIPIQLEGNIQRIPPAPTTGSGSTTPQTPQSAGGPGPGRRFGPVPYNSPMNMYSPQAMLDSFKQMQSADLQSGVNRLVIDDEAPRTEPTQSKSFRVLQKITDDAEQRAQQRRKVELTGEDKSLMDSIKARVDEGSSLHNTAEPRFRGSNIPSRAFRTLQNNLPPNPETQEESSSTSQRPSNPVTHTIKIQMPTNSEEPKEQPWVPASQRKVPEPKMYMGGNIPSRSFKILQAMTGESDAPIPAALGSDVGPDHMNVSYSSEIPYFDPETCPFPYPPYQYYDNDGNYLCVPPESYPENFDPNYDWESWEAYNYWYYCWYYANFWNPETNAFEFPEGWENMYDSSYEQEEIPQEISIPSKSFRKLQKSVECEENQIVPKIIIGSIGDGNKKLDCDQVGLKIGTCRDGKGDCKINRKELVETESGRNEETDYESACEGDTSSSAFENEGFVDEPETQSSEDDASTLTDESQPVNIEEYFSGSESPFPSSMNNRHLSTIEELSENELPPSPNINLNNVSVNLFSEEDEEDDSSSETSSSSEDDNSSASVIENKSGEYNVSSATINKENDEKDSSPEPENQEDEEDEDVEGDENENFQESTVTVRLPLKLSFTKSKSYRDIATVLVCDSQIETGDVENSSSEAKKNSFEGETNENKEGNEILSIRETSEVSSEDSLDSSSSLEAIHGAAVSYTITISRSDPKSKGTGGESISLEKTCVDVESITQDDGETGLNGNGEDDTQVIQDDDDDEVDFWGEIINKSSESPGKSLHNALSTDSETEIDDGGVTSIAEESNEQEEEELEKEAGLETEKVVEVVVVKEVEESKEEPTSDDEGSIDFWEQIVGGKEKCEESQVKVPDVNFWDKQEILSNRFNFIESHRSFELTEDYHRERENAMQLLIISDSKECTKEGGISCQDGTWILDEKKKNGWGSEVESRPIISETNANDECRKLEEDDDSGDNPSESTRKRNENEGDKSNEVDDGNNSSRRGSEDEGRNSCRKNRKASNGFRPVDSPISLSVSDETSDESSSRSSGTTIGRQEKGSGNESDPGPKTEECGNNDVNKDKERTPEPEKHEIRQVPIKQIAETSDSICTHQVTDRVAKAESLLWRIEKFLHESLSLGSEDDSGFMTDFSRPISECETDYDIENDVAAGVASNQKKSNGCSICSGTQIIAEEKVTKSTNISETVTVNKTTEEKVTLRKATATGRKGLNYQRAKTHSRLFQLLQEECGRDEDEEDGDENVEFSEDVISNGIGLVEKAVAIEIEASEEEKALARSRLMTPLPIKTNFPTLDSNSNSTSSPSGSSGVLSPTSPAHRDQLLADIINEFHLRVNDSTKKTKRNPNFPSKIFKLLQEEFGEEFYDTFHCGDDFLQLSLPITLNPPRDLMPLTNQLQVQENTLHKDESVTKADKSSIRKRDYTVPKSNVQEAIITANSKSSKTGRRAPTY